MQGRAQIVQNRYPNSGIGLNNLLLPLKSNSGTTTDRASEHRLIQGKTFPYLALALGVLCLGASGILVGLTDAPGPVMGFYRMAVAIVALAVPFFLRMKGRPISLRELLLCFLGGIFLALDLAFWMTGVNLSGATIPTLLGNTAPLWVGLGTVLLFRNPLKIQFWVGLGLALLGAAFIIGLDSLKSASFGLGTLFGLLSGFFYGGYMLITQVGRKTMDPFSYFWPAALSAAAVLFLTCLAFGMPITGYPLRTYILFIVMGIVVQVLGYLCVNYALGHLPASLVSPTLLGQPVLTAIFAGPVLGEGLSSWQIFGGLAVLLGIYLVHRSNPKPPPVAPPA